MIFIAVYLIGAAITLIGPRIAYGNWTDWPVVLLWPLFWFIVIAVYIGGKMKP